MFIQRVLVLSSNLERASLCVLAIGALLRPFRWHHIFIPVFYRIAVWGEGGDSVVEVFLIVVSSIIPILNVLNCI